MRRQRPLAANSRSTLPRRARSLGSNKLGPDGARALAPALEKMVGLKELKCVTNATRPPTPLKPPPPRSQSPLQPPLAGWGGCACTIDREDGRAEGARVRRQRRQAADPRSNLPRRARSLGENGLGPDGARALAPALEKMVGLKKLECAANAARQPTPGQTFPAALAVSGTTSSARTGRVRLHRGSRSWSG